MTVKIQYYDSPCGRLILGEVHGELCLCDWVGKPRSEQNRRRLERAAPGEENTQVGNAAPSGEASRRRSTEFREETSPLLERAKQQLGEYFAQSRQRFDIPLRPVGTEFQRRVWTALLEIPFGETRTYGEIALRVGSPRGVRATAQAIGANGLSIFIPCHRVIGSDRSLTGFAGGLAAKKALLELENPVIHEPKELFIEAYTGK